MEAGRKITETRHSCRLLRVRCKRPRAAAPPSTDMKSRRLMLDLPPPKSVYCTFNLP